MRTKTYGPGKWGPVQCGPGDTVEHESDHRRAIFSISAEVLVEMFKGLGVKRMFTVTDGAIPDDARVIGAQYNAINDSWELCLESESFEPIPAGQTYPRMRPTVMLSYESGGNAYG